jgi:membrane-associated protease RseP (regulator of RpoE activity)
LFGITPTCQAGAQQRVALEGVSMRFSLWSDYGTARKYGISPRGPSIGRKIFLTAVIAVAAVIGVRELYGQAVEKRGMLEPTARPQSLVTPSANATGRRSAGVAAIPLSPQPVLAADHTEVVAAAIVSPVPVPTPKPASEATAAEASAVSGDHAIPPALTAIPGAQAKANALPRPPVALAAIRPGAALATTKSADGPRNVGTRNVVHVAHRTRHDGKDFVGYAEAIAARFGHSRELRAALQSFL